MDEFIGLRFRIYDLFIDVSDGQSTRNDMQAAYSRLCNAFKGPLERTAGERRGNYELDAIDDVARVAETAPETLPPVNRAKAESAAAEISALRDTRLDEAVTALLGAIGIDYRYGSTAFKDSIDSSRSAFEKYREWRAGLMANGPNVAMIAAWQARQTEVERDLAALKAEMATAAAGIKSASDAAERAEGVAKNAQETAKGLIDDLKGKFDAALEEARARGITDGLKIEWKNRGDAGYQQAFWSYAVIAALIVGPFLLFIANYDAVVTYLKTLGTLTKDELGDNPNAGVAAVVAISRLILYVVPLVLYFWLIRLAVRFNARAMMLMDDSRARATMLETYYRMIAKDAAKDEDRALVLAALFRPTPGYEADSGEPPTLLSTVLKMPGT